MGFDENTLSSSCHRRAGDRGNQLGLAACDARRLVGLLQAVGDICNDWSDGAHFWKAAHVHDQVAIAEHRAPFRQPNLVVPAFPDLRSGKAHGGR